MTAHPTSSHGRGPLILGMKHPLGLPTSCQPFCMNRIKTWPILCCSSNMPNISCSANICVVLLHVSQINRQFADVCDPQKGLHRLSILPVHSEPKHPAFLWWIHNYMVLQVKTLIFCPQVLTTCLGPGQASHKSDQPRTRSKKETLAVCTRETCLISAVNLRISLVAFS